MHGPPQAFKVSRNGNAIQGELLIRSQLHYLVTVKVGTQAMAA